MLSQAHRRSIHSSLTPILGEEETDALMSEFPASPRDDPATTTDLALLRSDIHQDFADFRAEVHQDITGLRAEVHDLFRQMAMWMVGAMIAGMGLAAGIGAAVAQVGGG